MRRVSHEAIDIAVVRRVLATLSESITTYDLSRHPDMKAAHAGLADERGWNARVGKFLSQRCPEVERRSSPGVSPARWYNRLASATSPGPTRPGPAVDSRPVPRAGARPAARTGSVGPQYAKDDPFKARMRLHQSWYRAEVLKVPHGRGPKPDSTRKLGNMLQPEAASSGRNFLSQQIFEVVRRRVGPGVEEYRVLHDMLSSQPMCFNLFAPLVDDQDLATDLIRALWAPRVRRVTKVEIEWAPQPASEYLDDGTSFDTFIEYKLDTGGLGFLGIETKLTEPFSPGHYDKPTYRRWMTPDAPWRDDAGADVARAAWNQLWRNHLLVWSMLRHPSSRYDEGRCIVVRHPEDARCGDVIAGYRRLLKDTRTLEDCPLDRVVSTWRIALGPSTWLDAFELRYLSLDRSRHLVTSEPGHGPSADSHGAIRVGHERTVLLLEDVASYRQTLHLYREVLGHGVYLRPTDAGLTVISLDHETDASMVGVGMDQRQHCLQQLPPTAAAVRAAYAGYLKKLIRMKRSSKEERFALELLSNALEGDLSLPITGVYLVHQEWRFPEGGRLDILGVDPVRSQLVVIELKSSGQAAQKPEAKKVGNALAQAEDYADRLFRLRQVFYPFFQRLARAMARAHGAPPAMVGVELDPQLRPRAEVLWPGEQT
jgi:hypothetical protein